MIVEYVMTREVDVPDLNAFRRLYPSVKVSRIDGKECYGECLICHAPILAGQKHVLWNDGKLTCGECKRQG